MNLKCLAGITPYAMYMKLFHIMENSDTIFKRGDQLKKCESEL